MAKSKETPVEEVVEATETKEKAAPKEIIRGRMPFVLVALIRFGDTKDMTVAEQASKFATTSGKISDIRKMAGFKYITETYKPTQADVDAGIERMKLHPRYDEENVDSIIEELTSMEVASEEEAAAFAEVKKSNRAQSSKTKDGDEANAGGGNNSGPAETEPADADDLLA